MYLKIETNSVLPVHNLDVSFIIGEDIRCHEATNLVNKPMFKKLFSFIGSIHYKIEIDTRISIKKVNREGW